MAQTLNGSIDGQISSQRAKLYVHIKRQNRPSFNWWKHYKN